MRTRLLPPPQLAPGLPTGNQPGGVFEASYNPDMYGNANYRTIQAASARVAEVPQKITRSRIGFERLSANGFGAYPPVGIPGWQMPVEASVPNGGVFNQMITGNVGTSPVPFRRSPR